MLKKFMGLFTAISMLPVLSLPMTVQATENSIEVTEYLNATWDTELYKDKVLQGGDEGSPGSYAPIYWCDSLSLRNWNRGNVTQFIDDPDSSRSGTSVQTTVAATDSFPAYFQLINKDLRTIIQNDTNLIYLSADIYIPESDQFTAGLMTWWCNLNNTRIGNFQLNKHVGIRAQGNNNQYSTLVSADKMFNTWYTLGILANRTDKTITYCLNGTPVTGAIDVPGKWDFTTNNIDLYVSRENAGNGTTQTVNLDNIRIYSVPEVRKTVEVGMNAGLPASADITLEKMANYTQVNKTISWNEYSTGGAGEFDVWGKIDGNIPVRANITVTDNTPASELMYAAEGVNATFDNITEGTAGNGTIWNNRLKAADWETLGVTSSYVSDPANSGRGISLKAPIGEKGLFSAYFTPTADLKSILTNAENDKIYFSADIYIDDNFTGKSYLYWFAKPNAYDGKSLIARWTLDETSGITATGGVKVAEAVDIKNKWHTFGVIVDKNNKTARYYYNNEYVTTTSCQWDGTVQDFSRMLYCNPTPDKVDKGGTQVYKPYNMYYDNIKVYTVPTYKEKISLGTEPALPTTLRTTKETGIIESDNIEWSEFDNTAGNKEMYVQIGGKYVAAELDIRELTIPYIISDHMIIQQGKPIKLWGLYTDGDVSVKIKNGETILREGVCTPDEEGNWSIVLEQLPAGGPYTIEFINGDTIKTIQDVMLGELWVMGGQSNMQQDVTGYNNLPEVTGDAKIEVKENNNIRFFVEDWTDDYPSLYQRHQQAVNNKALEFENIKGEWKIFKPGAADSIPAVGAKAIITMEEELNCAVGGINAALGGTSIKDHYAGSENGYVFRAGYPDAVKMNISGILWYQGEYEWKTEYDEYKDMMKTLVSGYRGVNGWNDESLYFIYAQLPSYTMDTKDSSGDEIPTENLSMMNWSMVRTSQLNALYEIENAGMVTTTDILPLGENDTVHRTNKNIIGKRFGDEALRVAYEKNNKFAAPMFGSAAFENGKAIVTFTNVAGGLKTTDGEAPREFEIAGSDGVYYPATAVIVGMNKVELANENVAAPEKVRYLDITDRAAGDESVISELIEKGRPDVNLVNSVGLPAATFSEKENSLERQDVTTKTMIKYNINDLASKENGVTFIAENLDGADDVYIALYNNGKLVVVEKAEISNNIAIVTIASSEFTEENADYEVKAFCWKDMKPVLNINSIK